MTNLATENHAYLSETVALRGQIEGGFIILAERLRKIRNERIYDPEYESFGDFLREMKISESTASKLINVYDKFVLRGGVSVEELSESGWTNPSIFLDLIPESASREDIRKLFDDVKLLDRTDAQRTHLEMKTGVDMAKCPHSDVRVLHVCSVCGIKLKENEEKAH